MAAPGDKITIDPSRPATLAQQIREQVTWLISSGTLGPGDELRSVRGLAADLGVNLHTVRAAYRQLDRDGLVDVRHGQRTRVAAFDPGRFWTHEAATRSHTVGVVLPSLGDPFYVPLLEAIEEEATAAGSLVLVCTTHD